MRIRLWLAALLFLVSCAASPTSTAIPTNWQTTAITDTDGTSFTVSDFAGKPVLVEFFATWCSNCRKQLADTNAAAAAAGDKAVFLALSVETDLKAADLIEYRDQTGFTAMRYAVLTPEVLAAVVASLGNSAANPPSTPHLVISPDGATGKLVTGFEKPGSILTAMGLTG